MFEICTGIPCWVLMTTVVRQQVSLPPEFVSRRVDSPWLPCGVTSIATTSSRRRRRQESRHRQGSESSDTERSTMRIKEITIIQSLRIEGIMKATKGIKRNASLLLR